MLQHLIVILTLAEKDVMIQRVYNSSGAKSSVRLTACGRKLFSYCIRSLTSAALLNTTAPDSAARERARTISLLRLLRFLEPRKASVDLRS